MREAREKSFAEAPVREAAHAGSAYPENPDELRETVDEWLGNLSQFPSGAILQSGIQPGRRDHHRGPGLYASSRPGTSKTNTRLHHICPEFEWPSQSA